MAIGVVNLGLSIAEIKELTLKQYVVMVRQYNRYEERIDVRNAVLCATVANGYSKKRVKPADFLPKEKKKKKQTPEDMLAMFQMLTKARPQ